MYELDMTKTLKNLQLFSELWTKNSYIYHKCDLKLQCCIWNYNKELLKLKFSADALLYIV